LTRWFESDTNNHPPLIFTEMSFLFSNLLGGLSMFKPQAAARIRGRENLGWVGIVRNGPVNSRVGILGPNDEVVEDTFLVPNQDLYNRRPLYGNLRRRPMNHHQGHTFAKTAVVRGDSPETRYFIVQEGCVESRLVAIGPDGKSTGESFAISNEYIEDRQLWHEPMQGTAVIDERGVLVVPVGIRRALGITGSQSVAVEQRDGGIFVRVLGPAENGEKQV
jgi:hypothetical protein